MIFINFFFYRRGSLRIPMIHIISKRQVSFILRKVVIIIIMINIKLSIKQRTIETIVLEERLLGLV